MMNPVRVLCAIIVVNSVLSCVQIYRQLGRLETLEVRLAEVEDRIVIQDEARREIQRLAMEELQKRRDGACQKRLSHKQSL